MAMFLKPERETRYLKMQVGDLERSLGSQVKTKEKGHQIKHVYKHMCECVSIQERVRNQDSLEGTRRKGFLG